MKHVLLRVASWGSRGSEGVSQAAGHQQVCGAGLGIFWPSRRSHPLGRAPGPWAEARAALRMAADEKGPAAGRAPGFGEAPLPPDAAAPALGSGSCAPQSLALAQPMPVGHPDLRLLPGEAAFQDLTEEPVLERPRSTCEAMWESSLLSLPFPRKLWILVNSSRFTAISWNEDGTCIGFNTQLFQKEVLDRDGLDKVFKRDCMESFVHQLNIYGFRKVRQDKHMSLRLNDLSTNERPADVLSKLHFYRSPLFKRDCPHLLVRMKRREHTKPASGQVGGKPAALGYLPPPSTSEPQDGLPPYAEDIQGTPSDPELDHASALARTDSVPPAPPRTAAEPPAPDHNAPALAPLVLLVPVPAEVAQPAEVPRLCCAWRPTHMRPPWPVLGLAAAPPQLHSQPPRAASGGRATASRPRLMTVVAARPAASPDLDPSAPEGSLRPRDPSAPVLLLRGLLLFSRNTWPLRAAHRRP
ncbi:heat shock transcription factor, X-linked-like [Mesoplodon densirostris]|uniref:heat shock transcription factor, X-linked-like n=1 Tax=Mesoplodon densirostris TaxID=48708 RepID=UPI0028DB4681|nr:heat shock transcription factor, X-linked-like [Mesoplodon densirostris]